MRRELNIFCLVLAIAATFLLPQIPCLADSPLRNDAAQAPKEGVIGFAAEVAEGTCNVADKIVVKPATDLTKGAIELTNKAVVKPATGLTKGAIELTNKGVVKPATDLAKGAIELTNEGIVKPTIYVAKGACKIVGKIACPLLKIFTFGSMSCQRQSRRASAPTDNTR